MPTSDAHGICYKMREARTGVTLGGIGTGGIQLATSGAFANSTLQNNWTKPIEKLLPGSFLAVRAGDQTRILQAEAQGGARPIEDLTYCGRFPFVDITYEDRDLPIDVSLQAFCPFVPYDSKSSGIPAIVLTFTLANPTSQTLPCSAALSWANDIGQAEKSVIYNFNAAKQTDGLTGVVMATGREDKFQGHEYAIAALDAEGLDISVLPEWNAARGGDFWTPFGETGKLVEPSAPLDAKPDQRTPTCVPPAGAVAASMELEPGEARSATFVLAWFMPNHYDVAGRFLGHMYANWFDGAWAVARRVRERVDYLRDKSAEWQQLVYDSSLPDAVKESMIAHTYILPFGAWWVKDGRLVFGECPGWLLEMAALRPYNMFVAPMFFPDLAPQACDVLAAHQLESGEIPTGLGNMCMDTPNYFAFRQQNSPSFVLNVFLDYLWVGGKPHLERMYDAVKRAVQFSVTLDTDGDLLLNSNCIYDIAWDTWPVVGTSEYVNQFWLVALRAAERMAEAMRDADFAAQCKQWADAATKNFEDQLWTGEYYAFYRDLKLGDYSSTCFLGQLYGSALGYILGLGHVLPAEHVRSAIDAIARINLPDSPYGATTGVKPDGRRDLSSTRNAQSHCITPTETFPYAAACILLGKPDPGLDALDKIWRFLVETKRDPFNSLLLFDPDTGENFYGRHYTDNLNSWMMLLAAEGIGFDLANGVFTLKPNIEPLTAPIFSKLFYGTMHYAQRKAGGMELELTNLRDEAATVQQFVTRVVGESPSAVVVTSPSGQQTRPRFEVRQGGELAIVEPLTFEPGATRIVAE